MNATPQSRKRIPVKQLLELQYSVTQGLEKSGSLQEALDQILLSLGGQWYWKRAEFWMVDPEGRGLRRERAWLSGGAPDAEPQRSLLARGKGLPGRCWARGMPLWVRSLRPERDLPEKIAPEGLAIESAFALPAVVNGNVLGVLLFFLESAARPGRNLRDFLSSLASQLGQFLQHAQADETARALAFRLLYAQDQERHRIARLLHESTAQDLAALKLNVSVLKQEQRSPDSEGEKALQEGLALLDKTIQDVRTLAYVLHPPELNEMGLAKALDTYVSGFSRRSGIEVEVVLPPALDPLPADVRTAIFRIAQEALTNVHQHSGSPRARLELQRHPDHLTLEIRDYGQGASEWTPTGQHLAVSAMGVGTAGMRERARQLNGELEILTGKKGTVVRAVLPLPGERG